MHRPPVVREKPVAQAVEPKTQFIRSLLRLLKTVEADEPTVEGPGGRHVARGRYQAARLLGENSKRIIMQANRRPPVPGHRLRPSFTRLRA